MSISSVAAFTGVSLGLSLVPFLVAGDIERRPSELCRLSLPWWNISITAACLSSTGVATSELAFRESSVEERFERLEGRKPKRDGILVK